jgi:hypothetical protein
MNEDYRRGYRDGYRDGMNDRHKGYVPNHDFKPYTPRWESNTGYTTTRRR